MIRRRKLSTKWARLCVVYEPYRLVKVSSKSYIYPCRNWTTSEFSEFVIRLRDTTGMEHGAWHKAWYEAWYEACTRTVSIKSVRTCVAYAVWSTSTPYTSPFVHDADKRQTYYTACVLCHLIFAFCILSIVCPSNSSIPMTHSTHASALQLDKKGQIGIQLAQSYMRFIFWNSISMKKKVRNRVILTQISAVGRISCTTAHESSQRTVHWLR